MEGFLEFMVIHPGIAGYHHDKGCVVQKEGHGLGNPRFLRSKRLGRQCHGGTGILQINAPVSKAEGCQIVFTLSKDIKKVSITTL